MYKNSRLRIIAPPKSVLLVALLVVLIIFWGLWTSINDADTTSKRYVKTVHATETIELTDRLRKSLDEHWGVDGHNEDGVPTHPPAQRPIRHFTPAPANEIDTSPNKGSRNEFSHPRPSQPHESSKSSSTHSEASAPVSEPSPPTMSSQDKSDNVQNWASSGSSKAISSSLEGKPEDSGAMHTEKSPADAKPSQGNVVLLPARADRHCSFIDGSMFCQFPLPPMAVVLWVPRGSLHQEQGVLRLWSDPRSQVCSAVSEGLHMETGSLLSQQISLIVVHPHAAGSSNEKDMKLQERISRRKLHKALGASKACFNNVVLKMVPQSVENCLSPMECGISTIMPKLAKLGIDRTLVLDVHTVPIVPNWLHDAVFDMATQPGSNWDSMSANPASVSGRCKVEGPGWRRTSDYPKSLDICAGTSIGWNGIFPQPLVYEVADMDWFRYSHPGVLLVQRWRQTYASSLSHWNGACPSSKHIGALTSYSPSLGCIRMTVNDPSPPHPPLHANWVAQPSTVEVPPGFATPDLSVSAPEIPNRGYAKQSFVATQFDGADAFDMSSCNVCQPRYPSHRCRRTCVIERESKVANDQMQSMNLKCTYSATPRLAVVLSTSAKKSAVDNLLQKVTLWNHDGRHPCSFLDSQGNLDHGQQESSPSASYGIAQVTSLVLRLVRDKHHSEHEVDMDVGALEKELSLALGDAVKCFGNVRVDPSPADTVEQKCRGSQNTETDRANLCSGMAEVIKLSGRAEAALVLPCPGQVSGAGWLSRVTEDVGTVPGRLWIRPWAWTDDGVPDSGPFLSAVGDSWVNHAMHSGLALGADQGLDPLSEAHSSMLVHPQEARVISHFMGGKL